MKVYVVLGQDTAGLASVVGDAFPDEHKKFGPGQWLVASGTMTTREIGDKLSEDTDRSGQVAVFAVTSFWGWHDKDVWEWIDTRKSRDG